MSTIQEVNDIVTQAEWIDRKNELMCHRETDQIDERLFHLLDKIIYSRDDTKAVQRFNIEISWKEIMNLDWRPRSSLTDAWLNDNIINSYMGMLNAGSKNNMAFPKIYAFSTYLAEKLLADDHRYENLRRWSSRGKVDLFSVDKVFIPINHANHWTLIIIHNDIRRIEYYDSLGNVNFKVLYRAQEYF